MKRFVILLVIIAVLLAGCKNKAEMIGGEVIVNNNSINKEVEEFQKLMDEDVYGDKKSVYWDGSEAAVIEDLLDDPQVDDGYSGAYKLMKIGDDDVWTAKIAQMDKDSYKIEGDDLNNYIVTGDGWIILISKAEFNDQYKELSGNSHFKDVTASKLDRNVGDKYNKSYVFRGIMEKDKLHYAAYVMLAEDFFNRTYKVVYLGIGNMSEIEGKALQLFSQFETAIE